MRNLKIKIEKAQLLGYQVELQENLEGVRVSATIGLFTEGGKEITRYTISTQSYNDDMRFDLPLEAISPLRELADILEAETVRHCRDNQTALDMNMITGDARTKRVTLDDRELTPTASQNVYNHSPDGFSWGYGGSGSAQLALAILLAHTGDKDIALKHYMAFKNEHIAQLEYGESFELEIDLDEVVNHEAGMLTEEKLKNMPAGHLFAFGVEPDSPEGIHMVGTGKSLRWGAFRGKGMHDWAIYCHWSMYDEYWIHDHGDKVHNMATVQKLVPCDEKALSLYRH